MIERLQRALAHIEELPPEAQEEIAEQIEDLTLPFDRPSSLATGDIPEALPQAVRDALAVIGAWSDLQDEDEFEAIDRMRHEVSPTPPIELDDL
jgi:hypothetical protein